MIDLSIPFFAFGVIMNVIKGEEAMDIIGLISALLCNTSLAVIDKTAGGIIKSKDSVLPFSFFKTVLCCVFAVAILPFGKHSISSAGVTVALAAGLCHALSVVLIMHCLRSSPAVYVNLFMASGILLPTCFDWAFVYHKIDILELILLIAVMISLSIVLDIKKEKSNVALLSVMFLCYGMLMVTQGAFPKVCENGSKALFSVIMYGSSAVMLGAVCLFKRSPFGFSGKLKGLGVLAAVLNLSINILLTALSSRLPSAAVFPAVHGLKLVAVALLSPLLWKEKLTAKQIVGSFLTIILICIIGG